MHIKRNVSTNIIQHIFWLKDTPSMRKDMDHVRKFEHLWLRPIPNSTNYLQPPASYVFSDAKRRDFVQLVSSTKTPSGYCATLQRHVGACKLGGMKSHDHHVLLQDILPASIWHSLGRGPREVIIQMGALFAKFVQKSKTLFTWITCKRPHQKPFACLNYTFSRGSSM